MKKILSIMLIFILSLTVVGTTDLLKAEATTDVTIYVHVHQFDGDYTNTGMGVWDGQTWNEFGDIADPLMADAFGAVIPKTYTAAEINAVSDEVEFKPTRDVNNDDNTLDGGIAGNSNYLAPDSIEGKVFADVTALKDGSETELHLYYVEGAKDFYAVAGAPVNGMFFNVYANPEVAANEMVYDGWGMHTWNNGLPDIDWAENPNQYAIEMELESNVGWIPARLGMIEVAPGNTGNAGFIAHMGDTKSCGSDMFFDTDDLLALDGMASVVYYQHGACEFAPDYATFLDAVATEFEINSGNRIVEGTQIASPDMMDVHILMEKTPEQLAEEYFMIKDAEGNEIDILDVTYPVMTFGSYESDVEIQTETHVIVFVDTDVDASNVALVGNIQGWAPDGDVITTLGQDINGFDVFEFTTFEAVAEFKFLLDEDANGFNWGDTELIGSNIVVDLSAGGTIQVFFDDATDEYAVVDATPIDADIANFTYTSGVTCAAGQNLFTLFLDTELDHTMTGLVGSIQEANNWSPENAIAPTGETADGEVVFEVCLDGTNVEYKVLYNDGVDNPDTADVDESGFNWGDRELVQSNVVVDFGEGTVDGEIAHHINGPITVLGDYEATLSASSIYRLSLYLAGDVDWSKIGIVGTVQANPWTPAEAVTYKEMDQYGNAIFDIAVGAKTGEYLVLYDANDDGFDWDDKISGDANITYDLGEFATLVQYGKINMSEGNLIDVGDFDVATDLEAYGTFAADGASLTLSLDTDMLKAEVVSGANPWTPRIDLMGIPFVNGVTYRVSFDAKSSVADKKIQMQVGELLSNDPWFTDFMGSAQEFVLTTEMANYSFEFTMGMDNQNGGLTFEMGNLTDSVGVNADIYFDNIVVEEAAAVSMSFQDVGATIDEIVTTMATLHVAPDTFAFDGEYMVSYMDGYALVEDTTTLASDLFFSEYIEGGGNNKAIEIYNPTGADVDLTLYAVQENYGSGTNTYDLTGTLAAGDVLVLCTDAIDAGTNLEANCDVQFAYPSVTHFNGDDTLQLQKDSVVIDQIGVEADAGGDNFAKDVTLVRNPEVYMGVTEFDMDEWMSSPQNTFDYIGAHDFAPVEPFYIMMDMVPVVLANNFAAADVVAEAGTYAIMPDHIQVAFDNAILPMDGLMLKDATGTEVPFATYGLMYGPGAYTPVGTCAEGEQQIFVHINVMDTVVPDKAQLGIVGTINGWDIGNAIQAAGMDDAGNYVFEVCLPGDATGGEFKVKFDSEADGFTWDGVLDPELTPGNVVFDVADGPNFYVEEGTSALNVSRVHSLTLSGDNTLDKTSSYTLEFTDAAGFVISIPVEMDNTAPVIQATVKPGVALEFDGYGQSYSDFDFFDYFDILTFVDTRDGDLGFEIEKVFYPSLVGEQTIIISATDAWGNKATYEIVLNVVNNDVDAPVITGTASATFTEGDAEPDWASYVVANDGTLTINDSQVDMDTVGTFFVIYTAEDEAGNTTTFNLEVTIQADDTVVECDSGFALVDGVCVEDVIEDTGCFANLNIASSIIFTVIAVLGGAVLVIVRKR